MVNGVWGRWSLVFGLVFLGGILCIGCEEQRGGNTRDDDDDGWLSVDGCERRGWDIVMGRLLEVAEPPLPM